MDSDFWLREPFSRECWERTDGKLRETSLMLRENVRHENKPFLSKIVVRFSNHWMIAGFENAVETESFWEKFDI